MVSGNIVDELHDDNSFYHSRTAKESHFSAIHVRFQKIDHLNPRLKNLRSGDLIDKCRGGSVNGKFLLADNLSLIIFLLTQNIHDAAQAAFPNWNRNGSP